MPASATRSSAQAATRTRSTARPRAKAVAAQQHVAGPVVGRRHLERPPASARGASAIRTARRDPVVEVLGCRGRSTATPRQAVPEREPGRLDVPVPEPVAARPADQHGGARPVVGGDVRAQPADDGDGRPGGLALDQVGGRGGLVGDAADGDLEGAAGEVHAAAHVVEDRETRCAQGEVADTLAPRTAAGVGDEHRGARAGELVQPGPQRPGGRVGVGREQQHDAVGDVGRVDAGGGQDRADPGAHHAGAPAVGQGRGPPPRRPTRRRARARGRPPGPCGPRPWRPPSRRPRRRRRRAGRCPRRRAPAATTAPRSSPADTAPMPGTATTRRPAGAFTRCVRRSARR